LPSGVGYWAWPVAIGNEFAGVLLSKRVSRFDSRKTMITGP
jgi:hypothetical protein